jgi:precorrin-2 dehydrogenase/sirohydrochlorin ferrochelatase
VKHQKRSSSSLPLAPNVYYPVFLNLFKKKVIVCGGGRVAERKILTLCKAGADVTVISPEITKRLEREKQKGNIKHICRKYRRSDLKNAFLVIAATNSYEINTQISRDTPLLVNVVDTPHLCNFIVPSVIQRGPLTIAVSTSGISPALSKSIRKEIESIYTLPFASYVKSLRKVRSDAKRAVTCKEKREALLNAIASEKVLGILRKKGLKETKKIINALFKKATMP